MPARSNVPFMRPKAPRRGGARDFQSAQAVGRPVSALADSFVGGVVIPPHAHQRAQLIYAVKGLMTVQADGRIWMLPPSHALWVPGGITHQIRMNGPVEMRSLYVDARLAVRIKRACAVIYVSPLLRELIGRAMDLPSLYDERGSGGRVMRLILDEIASLPAEPLGLRMPRDKRLLRICQSALNDVSGKRSLEELTSAAGLSERTAMRLFPEETGLTFGQWVTQAKLLKAFELFDQGYNVTRVALELGYSSPSAFSKMFRKSLGRAPIPALRERGRVH